MLLRKNFGLVLHSLCFLFACIGVAKSTSEEELACDPHNSLDCYPKIFKPTDNWQPIRYGQEIPPGLHVRLNLDNMVREAKLLDPEEETQEETDLIIKDNMAVEENGEDKLQQLQSPEKGRYASMTEKEDLASSLKSLRSFVSTKDLTKVDSTLELLIDLSHDIELGAQLTQDPSNFRVLLDLKDTFPNDNEVMEKSCRIIGSCLRNNPVAISNTVEGQSETFFNTLLKSFKLTPSLILKKRILGIVLPLSESLKFRSQCLVLNNPRGFIDAIVESFPRLDGSSQERAVLILQNAKLVPSATGGQKDGEKFNPVLFYSSLLQQLLREDKLENEEQFKLFFNALCELHESNEDLKCSKEFEEWIAHESNLRVERIQNKYEKPVDEAFDKNFVRARHEIFGNPMAMRKIMLDEL